MAAERIPRQRVGRYPLDVFRVEAGTSHFIRTLDATYGGLFTHYVKPQKRSWYCPGEHCTCQWHKLDRVWKGYTSVELWDKELSLWSPCVQEITEALEICFRGRFDRGQVWELSRAAASKGKDAFPVVGRLVEELKGEVLPDPYPVKPVLMRLYHRPEGIETVWKNPMPAPVMVQPSQGKAPPGAQKPQEGLPADPAEANRVLREHLAKRAQGIANGIGHKGGDS